jgi:hypothetical protein
MTTSIDAAVEAAKAVLKERAAAAADKKKWEERNAAAIAARKHTTNTLELLEDAIKHADSAKKILTESIETTKKRGLAAYKAKRELDYRDSTTIFNAHITQYAFEESIKQTHALQVAYEALENELQSNRSSVIKARQDDEEMLDSVYRWKFKGTTYMRNAHNHCWDEKLGCWAGVYIPETDSIDTSVKEPAYYEKQRD